MAVCSDSDFSCYDRGRLCHPLAVNPATVSADAGSHVLYARMSTQFIWVHKRHAEYPTIQVGFRYVAPEIAARMIADGCAQNRDTDNKRLHHMTAEVYKPVKAEAETDPAPEPVPVEELDAESVEDEAPKPAPKRRTYKRRDVTAEK